MNLRIHRGTQEIGGNCVELWGDTSRIVLDIGMPLVEKDGSEFDFSKYKKLTTAQLIQKGILPDIDGFYQDSNKLINGLVISHSHLDHYGFISFLHGNIPYYLGEATHKLIDLTSIFTSKTNPIKNFTYFKSGTPFYVNDFSITPFSNDHSAFDAYSFFIEYKGKSIFYSGDFRGHGRKSKMFKWFLHNAPRNVDYLLMEGTQIGKETKGKKSEKQIEDEFVKLFTDPDKINLIYTSGQNIDRLVSVYRACLKTNKILIVDIYVATILKALSSSAKIPYPSKDFSNIKVIYPKWTSDKLTKNNHMNMLYRFKTYKITKEEVSKYPNRLVMIVRPSMKFDLDRIDNIDGGNLIYSLWTGYLQKPYTKQFVDYLKDRGFSFYNIHTSGHADLNILKQMVKAVNPKNLIPIHTFKSGEYESIFDVPVKVLKDGEILSW